jgi:hypothetical protein
MGTFERNDRVRLQRKIAENMMRERPWKGSGRQIDWHARRGTIIRLSRVTDNVWVLWDDRASVDQWPFRALEKA